MNSKKIKIKKKNRSSRSQACGIHLQFQHLGSEGRRIRSLRPAWAIR
jgi:hypothetical protein